MATSRRQRQWVYAGAAMGRMPKPDEKREITAACEQIIAEVIRPRHLPRIMPTQFNYPVGISGKWHGNKYRFMSRFRSGFDDNRGEEFDAPFACLEYVNKRSFRCVMAPTHRRMASHAIASVVERSTGHHRERRAGSEYLTSHESSNA